MTGVFIFFTLEDRETPSFPLEQKRLIVLPLFGITVFPFSREQQDVHGYERKVQEMSKLLPSPPPQEAEAVEVASVTHQGPELKQRVETIVVREVRAVRKNAA